MSFSLNLWIFLLVAGNLLGCLWLIWWTAKPRPGEEDEGATKEHVWDGDLQELNNPMPRWWLYMFLISIAIAVVYLALYPGLGSYEGTLGWSQKGQHDERLAVVQSLQEKQSAVFAGIDAVALASDPAAALVGAKLFTDNCSGCHGPSGQGAVGFPRLTDNDWLYGNSAEQIRHSVAHGRAGVMPAFGTFVKPAEIAGVVAILQNWEAPAVDAEQAEAGRKTFASYCTGCHGAEGGGNQMMGAPNLRDDIWLYGGGKGALHQTVTKGRSGQMPAHADRLSETDIELLVAYLLRVSNSVPDTAQ